MIFGKSFENTGEGIVSFHSNSSGPYRQMWSMRNRKEGISESFNFNLADLCQQQVFDKAFPNQFIEKASLKKLGYEPVTFGLPLDLMPSLFRCRSSANRIPSLGKLLMAASLFYFICQPSKFLAIYPGISSYSV